MIFVPELSVAVAVAAGRLVVLEDVAFEVPVLVEFPLRVFCQSKSLAIIWKT